MARSFDGPAGRGATLPAVTRAVAWILSGTLLLATGACRQRPPTASAAARGTEGSTRPVPEGVRDARRRLRAYDTTGALTLLEADRALTVAAPERSWLLAHLWRERTEGARARAAARTLPPGVFRTALEASLAEDPEIGLARVQQALRSSRDPWLHLAAAWLHLFRQNGASARAHAYQALGQGWAFLDVEARLVLARSGLEDGNLREAEVEALRAAAIEPTNTRAVSLAAEAARRDGRLSASAEHLLEAIAWSPRSEAYPRRLADVLRRDPADRALAARVEQALGRLGATSNPERRALEGLLAERCEALDLAVDHYSAALAGGAAPIPVERDLRRLLARRGEYEHAVALLLRATPDSVRRDPANRLGRAWAEVETAAAEAPGPVAGEARRFRLARALVEVGALAEARAVLADLPGEAARALASRLDGQLAFVDALEAWLEGGYRKGHRHEDPPGFDEALRVVAALAARHLPREEAAAFAQPTKGLREVSFVGCWLDHSTDTTSPVVAHFRRYGSYLVFGQRAGQPVEAVLLSLASLTRGEEIRTRGHRLRQDVAIGYDRRLRPFVAARGGDLGGACLPDGIWMDADSVRSVEHGLRRAATRDPGAVAIARRSPRLLDADTPEGPFALGDPAGVGERLALRYLERKPDDPWGSLRTLRAHECGHLVEIRRHLPIARGLPSSAALLVSSRLSLAVAEMELERRAQLAAVAESPDPDLALAEMLVLLPVVAREPDPHDGGYEEGVRRLVRHVASRPDLYPAIDRSYRILPQLDRLTNEQIRRAARAVLPR